MSHVQEDHDEAFLPFVGIIIAELTSATVVKLSIPTFFLPSSRNRTKAIGYASSDLEDFGKQGVPGQVR